MKVWKPWRHLAFFLDSQNKYSNLCFIRKKETGGVEMATHMWHKSFTIMCSIGIFQSIEHHVPTNRSVTRAKCFSLAVSFFCVAENKMQSFTQILQDYFPFLCMNLHLPWKVTILLALFILFQTLLIDPWDIMFFKFVEYWFTREFLTLHQILSWPNSITQRKQ